MDLRTKLVFAFVSVSLVSMFALTWLTYGPARDVWRGAALNNLQALAESKQSDIERVVEGWRDQVRLISSRTQLRRITAEYDATHTATDASVLVRILTDAQAAIRGSEVLEITVYDTHQHVIASTLWPADPAVEPLDVALLPGQETPRLVSFHAAQGDVPEVLFTTPIEREGVVVGTVLVRMTATQLAEVTDDYDGLGETGEALLAVEGDDGRIVFIGTPRHAVRDDLVGQTHSGVSPLREALDSVETTFFTDAFDYRGESVWAATRFIDDLGAGLVVKMDRSEQEAPQAELRATTIRLALALSAFAIVAAGLMGLSFATPIHQLAEVAEEIHEGNYRVRAPVRREDEIGRLAFLFNRMTDSLLESNRQLRRRITEQDRVPGGHEHEGTVTGDEDAPEHETFERDAHDDGEHG